MGERRLRDLAPLDADDDANESAPRSSDARRLRDLEELDLALADQPADEPPETKHEAWYEEPLRKVVAFAQGASLNSLDDLLRPNPVLARSLARAGQKPPPYADRVEKIADERPWSHGAGALATGAATSLAAGAGYGAQAAAGGLSAGAETLMDRQRGEGTWDLLKRAGVNTGLGAAGGVVGEGAGRLLGRVLSKPAAEATAAEKQAAELQALADKLGTTVDKLGDLDVPRRAPRGSDAPVDPIPLDADVPMRTRKETIADRLLRGPEQFDPSAYAPPNQTPARGRDLAYRPTEAREVTRPETIADRLLRGPDEYATSHYQEGYAPSRARPAPEIEAREVTRPETIADRILRGPDEYATSHYQEGYAPSRARPAPEIEAREVMRPETDEELMARSITRGGESIGDAEGGAFLPWSRQRGHAPEPPVHDLYHDTTGHYRPEPPPKPVRDPRTGRFMPKGTRLERPRPPLAEPIDLDPYTPPDVFDRLETSSRRAAQAPRGPESLAPDDLGQVPEGMETSSRRAAETPRGPESLAPDDLGQVPEGMETTRARLPEHEPVDLDSPDTLGTVSEPVPERELLTRPGEAGWEGEFTAPTARPPPRAPQPTAPTQYDLPMTPKAPPAPTPREARGLGGDLLGAFSPGLYFKGRVGGQLLDAVTKRFDGKRVPSALAREVTAAGTTGAATGALADTKAYATRDTMGYALKTVLARPDLGLSPSDTAALTSAEVDADPMRRSALIFKLQQTNPGFAKALRGELDSLNEGE